MRALILNERDPRHPRAGGAETHLSEIFRRLAARGLEVTLACSSFPHASALDQHEGLQIQRLGPLPGYYPRAGRLCARETRRGRFDVVVDCLNKLPFMSPAYSHAPVLALCHHLFGATAFRQVAWPIAAAVWSAEQLIPRVYRRTRFATISESSRDDLIARGIPADQIEVHHPGIRPPGVEARPLNERAPQIVYLGRLEPYKNVDVALGALARVARNVPEVSLVIVGSGSDRKRLEGIASRLGVTERTRFTGFVEDDERNRILAESRVCVCPSSKEGWGLTVIESNALGTPNVASDAPGLRDSVRHGETGFLVEEGDTAAFAARIEELLCDNEAALRMSRAASHWARRFRWEEAAERMQGALDATVRGA